MSPSGQRNTTETEQYRLTLPAVVDEYLRALVTIGTYGNSPQAALEKVVQERIDALIADGTLRRRPSQDPL
jgi:hypothetical protein